MSEGTFRITCGFFDDFSDHCRSCHFEVDYTDEYPLEMDFYIDVGGKKFNIIIGCCCGFKEWYEGSKPNSENTVIRRINELYFDEEPDDE